MQAVQKLSTCNNFNTIQADADTGYIWLFIPSPNSYEHSDLASSSLFF